MNLQTVLKIDDQEIIDNMCGSMYDRRRGEEQLFQNYSYFIREAIRKYSFSHDEAFDVYSDSILATIDKICNGLFRGESSLKTFAYQIFHNKCIDQIRRKTTNKYSVNRTVSFADIPGEFSDAAKSAIQKIMEKSDRDFLRQKLNGLGDNCRKLLLLWADGYTDKEIVSSLDYKTTDVVKNSRLRCLGKLRQFYKNTS